MSNHLKWTEGNSKLQKTSGADVRVLGYGIPADFNFELAGEIMNTCPGALACRGVCYAKQGSYTWAAVKAARKHNLDAFIADPEAFVAGAIADLERLTRRYRVVRVHDSGDFFSQSYLDAWCRISGAFPGVVFYAYTKSFHLDWNALPANFHVTQSMGGRFDVDLDFDFPHARIFATHEDRIAADYVDGSESDWPAINGDTRIGLVYHGNKNLTDAQRKYFA
jgi:hypothetical protein